MANETEVVLEKLSLYLVYHEHADWNLIKWRDVIGNLCGDREEVNLLGFMFGANEYDLALLSQLLGVISSNGPDFLEPLFSKVNN